MITITKNIIEASKAFQKRREKYRKQFFKGNELNVINQIKKELLSNPNLDTLKLFLELMQLSKDPKVFKEISLKEIEILYKKLSSIFPTDIELNIEYYYFLSNVLDKEEQANTYLKEYKKKVFQQINSAFKKS